MTSRFFHIFGPPPPFVTQSHNISVLFVTHWVTPLPLERDIIYGWSLYFLSHCSGDLRERVGGEGVLPARRGAHAAQRPRAGERGLCQGMKDHSHTTSAGQFWSSLTPSPLSVSLLSDKIPCTVQAVFREHPQCTWHAAILPRQESCGSTQKKLWELAEKSVRKMYV